MQSLERGESTDQKGNNSLISSGSVFQKFGTIIQLIVGALGLILFIIYYRLVTSSFFDQLFTSPRKKNFVQLFRSEIPALTFLKAFHSYNVHWLYSTPLTVMWLALGTFWWCALFSLWYWAAFAGHTKAGVLVYSIASGAFALMGFLCLVGFGASNYNEGSAAGASLLWIACGGLSLALCLVRLKQLQSSAQQKRACCSANCWGVGVIVFLLIWCFVFTAGFTIQALATSAESHEYPPMGRIYRVSGAPAPVELQMHMFCMGPTNSTRPTVILEHGGGANSVSMMPLQRRLAAGGRRVCVYDRLGYGWTPSLYPRRGDAPFPSSGELLVRLLRETGERAPFSCAGWSAGSEACLNFCFHAGSSNCTAIAGLDGYPELIVSGAYRPGVVPNSTNNALSGLGATEGFAFFAGPTGLSRGQLGVVGPSFGEPDLRGAHSALYSLTRFWLSQYLDLRGSILTTANPGFSPLMQQMGASRGPNGLVTYNRSLDAHVMWLPAFNTVIRNCTTYMYSDFCCGPYASDFCRQQEADSLLYMQQVEIYVATIGISSGILHIAPEGTSHGYVQEIPSVDWLSDRLLEDSIF